MNSYKLTNVETQCLASHCSIKRSPMRRKALRLYCWFSHSKTVIVHAQEKKS
ncbi:MAG: hypothetical protein LBB88_01080 [Planctomycetaceae bacterium]|nr:hypothetical protein [Planctomycetaceae bacterium]